MTDPPHVFAVHAWRRYPWDQWANGRSWLLRLGIDYSVSTASFIRHARRVAAKRGCRLFTAEAASTDRVIIMFIPLEEGR